MLLIKVKCSGSKLLFDIKNDFAELERKRRFTLQLATRNAEGPLLGSQHLELSKTHCQGCIAVGANYAGNITRQQRKSRMSLQYLALQRKLRTVIQPRKNFLEKPSWHTEGLGIVGGHGPCIILALVDKCAGIWQFQENFVRKLHE